MWGWGWGGVRDGLPCPADTADHLFSSRLPASPWPPCSGHDSSLMPLLAALGKSVTDWPPYLSNLTLELWRQPQGQQYVKVGTGGRCYVALCLCILGVGRARRRSHTSQQRTAAVVLPACLDSAG